MSVIKIKERAIIPRRRDGQISRGSNSFSGSKGNSDSSWMYEAFWGKVEIPNLDKLRIDEAGNLIVPGNIIAFGSSDYVHDMIAAMPVASVTSKGLAQFSDSQFTVVNGVVSIKSGVAGLDESALASYLDSHSYATESFVTSRGYLTSHQSLADLALKDHLHSQYLTSHQSLSGYATENYVTSRGYLTTHQSLANLALKTHLHSQYLTSHQSLNGYATESWVNSRGYLTTETDTLAKVIARGSDGSDGKTLLKYHSYEAGAYLGSIARTNLTIASINDPRYRDRNGAYYAIYGSHNSNKSDVNWKAKTLAAMGGSSSGLSGSAATLSLVNGNGFLSAYDYTLGKYKELHLQGYPVILNHNGSNNSRLKTTNEGIGVYGNNKIYRLADISTYMNIVVSDVRCTYEGFDTDGWMSHSFKSNNKELFLIGGYSSTVYTKAKSVIEYGSNTEYAATIKNGGGEALGLLIRGGSGGSRAKLLTLRNNHDNDVVKIDDVGNIKSKGSIIGADNVTAFSDMRLKDFKKPLISVLNNIDKLSTFYYHWKDKEKCGSDLHLGLSAQTVDKLFPDFVVKDDVWSLDYGKLGAVVAVRGLQEVKHWMSRSDKRILELEKEVNNLKKRIGYAA